MMMRLPHEMMMMKLLLPMLMLIKQEISWNWLRSSVTMRWVLVNLSVHEKLIRMIYINNKGTYSPRVQPCLINHIKIQLQRDDLKCGSLRNWQNFVKLANYFEQKGEERKRVTFKSSRICKQISSCGKRTKTGKHWATPKHGFHAMLLQRYFILWLPIKFHPCCQWLAWEKQKKNYFSKLGRNGFCQMLSVQSYFFDVFLIASLVVNFTKYFSNWVAASLPNNWTQLLHVLIVCRQLSKTTWIELLPLPSVPVSPDSLPTQDRQSQENPSVFNLQILWKLGKFWS